MDKNYTNQELIEQFIGEEVNDSLQEIIVAVQKYIDNYTGRNFKADCTASARLYNGNNSQYLNIDDCIEIAKVEIGNDSYGDTFTEIASTGSDKYYTLPDNNEADGYPINKLFLRSREFLYGIQNQRITAKWGFSKEVPDDISWVATFLSASVYKTGIQGSFAGVKSERIGEYNVTFGGDTEGQSDYDKAKVILDSYKKYVL